MRELKVFIDNNEVDIDQNSSISISLGVASMTEIESGRIGYSKTITLPMTSKNREIMGDVSHPNSVAKFNQKEHWARVEFECFRVFEGVPMLIACRQGGLDAGAYQITIIGPGKEWVKYAAQTPFRAIPIDYSKTITASGVRKSWDEESPVRFLPVQRDNFEVENLNANLFPPVKALTFEDYHPFLHVRTLMEKIFNESGYKIESSFMKSSLFDSLYMSGNYPTQNMDSARATMDFRAGRFNSASAVADRYGRVYASPLHALNTIGNIVDSADPEDKSGGDVINGVFSMGGYFAKDGKRIVFSPPREIVMSFEFKLHYTTDYYMESRDKLQGFTIVNLGDEVDRNVSIANRNSDRRNELRANRNYMAIVFDHNPQSTYQLRYDEVINDSADLENLLPKDINTTTHSTFTTRTHSVTITSSHRICNPQLYEKKSGSSSYQLCSSDWALYDGHVKERGEKEVELTIRSSPERITPSKPKYFDKFSFGGAAQGMKLTLGKSTTIRPIFAEYPGEGSTVNFEKVAAHNISCLDFINAIKQMFNLHFYTDRFSEKVFIEPRNTFYLKDPIVDWRDRVDLSKPTSVTELGADMPRTMNFRYETGDGIVNRWNVSNQQIFGEWQAKIKNQFSSERESTYPNLFSPSFNVVGSFPDAPAASLLQVGDRQHSEIRSEDLNFAPKIVRYMGVTKLPQGQYWGWPIALGEYPLVAFHHTESINNSEKFTLCFEDRDGQKGLHRYWDENMELLNNGRRIELHLNLGAEDIEPFITQNALKKDFRAFFKIKIDEEDIVCRLEEICDYNPSRRESTKCRFVVTT